METEVMETEVIDITPAEEEEVIPKEIQVELNDKTYILAYDREAIKKMEAKGFEIANIETKLVTSYDIIIEGAFYKHYPHINQVERAALKEQIYEDYDVQELVKTLIDMMKPSIPFAKTNDKKPKKVFTVIK
jgi:hypothetical protein